MRLKKSSDRKQYPAGGVRLNSCPGLTTSRRSTCKSHMMGQVMQYHVFETNAGFCGIAWNGMGITRFQLPTRSAAATERLLRRRAPDAEPSVPPSDVVEAIAAVRRYFEGEETDFSAFRLDL